MVLDGSHDATSLKCHHERERKLTTGSFAVAYTVLCSNIISGTLIGIVVYIGRERELCFPFILNNGPKFKNVPMVVGTTNVYRAYQIDPTGVRLEIP